jgi:hypothetical protein
MINARGAFLEQRGNDDRLVFLRQPPEGVGAGPGDFLGQLEMLVILALTKILGAEEFLGADDLRALPRGALNCSERLLKIGGGIARARGLD